MQHQTMPSEAPDYELEDQIGFVLRLAVQFHTSIFTARMVDNLTQTQFATLAKVYQVGPCSQAELAKLLALDTATINGVVERMSARGFVISTNDPNDRRRQTLALTRKGHSAVKAAIAVAREITTETVAKLTRTEEARLIQILRKMIGAANTAVMPRATPKRQRPKATARVLLKSVEKV